MQYGRMWDFSGSQAAESRWGFSGDGTVHQKNYYKAYPYYLILLPAEK